MSTPATPSRPLRFGVRCGLALGLFEIGLAVPARFGGAHEPLRQALFFLLPLGAWSLLGLLLGAAGNLAGRLHPFFRLGLPGFLALALGVADGFLNPGELQRGWFLAIPLFLAGLWIVLGPWFRLPWRDSLLAGAGLGAAVLAAAGSLVWLGGERDPASGIAPHVTASPDHPTVVLVTWDTTRRDVLPLYGGTGLETPSLLDFASRSVVFDHMTSVAPITGPSHATLLTGVIPPTHGLRTHGTTRIADRVPRLAESFRDAGYDTAAFVAARPLLARNGFSKGFRFFDDRLRGERVKALLEIFPKKWNLLKAVVLHFRGPIEDTSLKVPGPEILERVAKYLPTVPGPAFLFVHFFDAHIPYDPPSGLLERAEREAAGATPPAADPSGGARFLTLYRAELMELDGYFGQLIHLLEERDPGLENTVVFMLADHGHCFGEGGYLNTHTPSLYEATQAIPAVLHLPGDRDSGRRVADTVNQVDVAATVCDLAGVAPPAGQQGISLLPAAEGKPLPKRKFFRDGFYMEAWHFDLQNQPRGGGAEGLDDRKQGLRTPQWKYWKWENGPERLFRLDQGEEEDLAGRFPEVLKSMRLALQKAWNSVPHASEDEAARDMESGERAELQQLGYLDGNAEEPAAAPAGGPKAPGKPQAQE